MYKFYIKMDGEIFGPYSAKGMLDLDVLPDIMVTEVSLDSWQPAANFDFEKLAKEEVLARLKNTPTDQTVAISIPDPVSNIGNVGNQTVVPSPAPANVFPQSIEYKANLNEGFNAIGGKIIITPTQLIFHPHKFNFDIGGDRYFEIARISGFKKGALTYLYIYFSDGNQIKLSVWSKSEIINQLEARRQALLNQH